MYSQPFGVILQFINSSVVTHWKSLIYSQMYLMARSESVHVQSLIASINLHSDLRNAVVRDQIYLSSIVSSDLTLICT